MPFLVEQSRVKPFNVSPSNLKRPSEFLCHPILLSRYRSHCSLFQAVTLVIMLESGFAQLTNVSKAKAFLGSPAYSLFCESLMGFRHDHGLASPIHQRIPVNSILS